MYMVRLHTTSHCYSDRACMTQQLKTCVQSNLDYPNQLGPGQRVRIIDSSDNQGKAVVFSIAWSALTCPDNQKVQIIEVQIIEVGLYTHEHVDMYIHGTFAHH